MLNNDVMDSQSTNKEDDSAPQKSDTEGNL